MAEIVEITGIAAGGSGVGRLADGRAVFVHRTAAGDRALVNLVEEKKNWTRGQLDTLVEPGPGRRAAPCPYYARCGGCTLEHLEYTAQLAAKSQLVFDALTRLGGLDVERPVVIGSPREFRYRNRVSFTLMRLAKRVVAGFHELERPGRVLDLGAACLMPEEAIAEAWAELRRVWGHNAQRLPSGPKLRLTLRASADGAVSLIVEGGYSAGRADELLEVAPHIQSIWHRAHSNEPMKLLAGRDAMHESWQDEDLEVSGSVFLQVNREAASLLEDYVMELAGDVVGKSVVDAYCGVGLHARRLARAGAQVTGIELDALAIDEARSAGIPNAEFVCGRVEEEIQKYLPADLAIINPPRAGIDESVTTTLNRARPRRIIYISCNPATLARDLGRMKETYRLKAMRCFDLFPQTAHVETVVELECAIT